MATSKLPSALLKINRAKEKIDDLQVALEDFLKSEPYKVTADNNPQTGQKAWRVTRCDEIPARIPIIAGEVVHDLRTALDYVAFQLFTAGLYCSSSSERDISFPVSADVTKHESKLARIVNTSRNDIAQAFDALKAYKGGNGHAFWAINELDNISKHRMLLTAGVAIEAIDFRSAPPEGFFSSMHPDLAQALGLSFIRIRPPSRLRIKTGDVLMGSNEHVQLDFTFTVTFDEVGVIEREPLVKTLNDFANLVGCVIPIFEAIL